jgi:dUTPase
MKLTGKAHAESSNNCLQFVKMTEQALTPTRESPRSAGLTLRSPYNVTVPARGKEVIWADLKLNFQGSATTESLQ